MILVSSLYKFNFSSSCRKETTLNANENLTRHVSVPVFRDLLNKNPCGNVQNNVTKHQFTVVKSQTSLMNSPKQQTGIYQGRRKLGENTLESVPF